MKVNVYTVSQINGYIKRLLENDVFLSDVCVEGEISNFKFHSSGHLYFSLKDETGGMDCVMFRSYAAKLDFLPENGEKVLVGGYVSLYEKTGKYQFYVTFMQPAGLGALHAAFERLKKKLATEGLFDVEHKKKLCQYPKTIAVVTSPTGAAVRDIIKVAGRRNPSVKIVVVPVLVQGENAAADIVRGIRAVNEWNGADVMIVGRGGGSMEDLWAFNEEIVARAIYESAVPVISAVGHEVDTTIADYVADVRAATPSAAAELAVPETEPMDKRNKTALRRIDRAMKSLLSAYSARFDYAVSVRAMKRPLDAIYNYQLEVEDCVKAMEKSMQQRLAVVKGRLEKNIGAIENLSPLNVLKRGYAIACDIDGGVLKSVEQVKADDKILINLRDGSISANVIEAIGRDTYGD